jgi:hypothetical protein
MGIRRETGYSAAVFAYMRVGNQRLRIAKMNREFLTLAEPCELAPGTEAELHVIVDRKKSSRTILLNDGIASDQREVRYSVLAPF